MPQPETPGTAESGADPRAGDAGTDRESEPRQPRRQRSFLTEMAVLFVVALTIALLIKSFVVQPFFIPSGSMENTLLIGDKVLVNKLVYHIRPIERGDIIVFNGYGSWDLPPRPASASRNPLARVYDDTLGALFRFIGDLFGTPAGQKDYIKRVIGLPGDHVACCNAHGDVTVNGVPLHEKSYLHPRNKPSRYPFNVVVPPGRLWVMGDHRADSADSRLHDCAYPEREACYSFDRTGTIPESKVIGRAFMIFWPLRRFRILPIPATFKQVKLLGSTGRQQALAARLTTAASAGGGLPVRPSSPDLPLALGLGFAIPLTAMERRLRLRLSARKARKRELRKRRARPRNGALPGRPDR